jgi:succinyl-diaminopimelate desuccinylase
MIKNGRRGTLSGTLVVQGVPGPHRLSAPRAQPIHLAAPLIAELAPTSWDSGNEYFPPTTWQCSNIHAGTGATQRDPGNARGDVQSSARPGRTRESLMQRFEAIVRSTASSTRSVDRPGKPFLTRAGARRRRHAIDPRVTGRVPELSCTGGTSDGRFIATSAPSSSSSARERDDPQTERARAVVATSRRCRAIYRGHLWRTAAARDAMISRERARRRCATGCA